MLDASVSQAARVFASAGGVAAIQPCRSGNVHHTYVVLPDGPGRPFILQRLNRRVFPEPQLLLHNLQVLSAHLDRRSQEQPPPQGRRWEMPRPLTTAAGAGFWLDEHGDCWRALSFIPRAHTVDTLSDDRLAWEVGYALVGFHLLTNDLPPQELADTLPGFHCTPAYLQTYDAVREQCPPGPDPTVAYAQQIIDRYRGEATILEDARQAGVLPVRVIHGDPKVNNVMLDDDTGQAVGLIDLDTVKPGLIHYDLGDCLRSGCNPLGEETTAWDAVRFDSRRCRAILTGYFSQARSLLRPADCDYLFDSVRLITFELGLRFFTDYLAGNVYFQVDHPRHNLDRAVVQFRLLQSLEAQADHLRRLFRELT